MIVITLVIDYRLGEVGVGETHSGRVVDAERAVADVLRGAVMGKLGDDGFDEAVLALVAEARMEVDDGT